MIDTQHHVDVFHALGADVGEFLDFGSRVLDLVVRHLELELLDTGLDCVPSSESVPNRNIASETEIFGLEDFVCAWVVENGFGVNASLVGEGTVPTAG